ncbi:hypothetical protein GGF46_003278 [Coemansia sp. RSA 552]|nr:hypothetical protein GGF46_003278 [Coemansia sp. RSA 552]
MADGADRFVCASLEILQQISGTGAAQGAAAMAREMAAAIESLEHSSDARIAAVAESMGSLQADLDAAHQALAGYSSQLCEARAECDQATAALTSTADAAQTALDAIERRDGAERDEERARLTHEAAGRSDALEQSLKTEHEEFKLMHARRMASVLRSEM